MRGWFGLRVRASHSSSASISILKSLWLSLDRLEAALHNKKLIKDLLCWRIRVRCTGEWLHLAPTSLLCLQRDAEPPRPSLSWLSHLPDSAPPPAALNTTTPRDNVSMSTTSTDRTALSRTMWRFLQRSKLKTWLKAVCFFHLSLSWLASALSLNMESLLFSCGAPGATSVWSKPW